MKKICVNRHIITFVEDGQTPETVDDAVLVSRLIDSPEVTDEIKALARMVLSLSDNTSEKNNAATN